MNLLKYLTIAATGAILLSSCKLGNPRSTNPGNASTATGIAYTEDEGFQLADYSGQPEGPGLVFIDGGRTTLGSMEEDLGMTRDNLERTVTIASFYMDEAEVANIHWLEYLHFIKKDASEEFYRSSLPDTTVWACQ